MERQKRKQSLQRYLQVYAQPRTIFMIIYDLITLNLSYFLALWVRFDFSYGSIPKEYLNAWKEEIPYITVATLVLYMVCKLYKSILKYAGHRELTLCTLAVLCSVAMYHVIFTFADIRMPYSYFVIGFVIQLFFCLRARFDYRIVQAIKAAFHIKKRRDDLDKVMLVGAGAAGKKILNEINWDPKSEEYVTCIIDDNSKKFGEFINGVRVVGDRYDIKEVADKYQVKKIYVALPSLSTEAKKEILQLCKETGCVVKNLPSSYKMMNDDDISVKQMKDVAVEDLLGRDTIEANSTEMLLMLRNRRVLVTGGGGSIGSELCRQIAAYNPSCLVIFDIYENNAYDIQQELRRKYPKLELFVIIGSVRDTQKVKTIFERFHPEYVYHAAAHKHVPLMEDSPCEAIKNNMMGTYNVAYNAMTHGCKRFVLISTDKAVNPTNIMGASKRLCEMVIQAFDHMVKEKSPEKMPDLFTHAIDWNSAWDFKKHGRKVINTEFVAVRFGNVLGSNGSVIPLFKKQIAQGGPVTVTHPDIIRYFMTIPEAVNLVLQAGNYAKGGEIFVLDMGDPVKIDDLARNLIRLSGYVPDEDIKVEYCGLRPGEKLFEEKLMAEEGLSITPNDLIHVGKPIPFEIPEFIEQLKILEKLSYDNNEDEIRDYVQTVVTTYHPA